MFWACLGGVVTLDSFSHQSTAKETPKDSVLLVSEWSDLGNNQRFSLKSNPIHGWCTESSQITLEPIGSYDLAFLRNTLRILSGRWDITIGNRSDTVDHMFLGQAVMDYTYSSGCAQC